MMYKKFLKLLSLVCAVALLSGCWEEPPADAMELPMVGETADEEDAEVVLPAAFAIPCAPDQTLDPVTCPDGVQLVVSSPTCCVHR